MIYRSTLLAVADMARSVAFYQAVLGLEVIQDFGANKTLTGGICLQTRESWAKLLDKAPEDFGWRGNVSELYFEEEDFDAFVRGLSGREICLVHPVREHPWGQRVVRFYDPDGHMIEVGESLETVCRRFLAGGMTPEQTARRMDVPVSEIRAWMAKEA